MKVAAIVLSCTCMVFAEKKPLAAETVMLQKKATMPRLMPSNSQSPSPSPRIRREKETLLENTWSGDENSWNETGDENSWNDGCDPYSSNGNACDPYGSDDGCDPYGSDPSGSDDGCDPYGSNGDACDPYAGGPSALPTCSGDENSWNAGYGSCATYTTNNHPFCSGDSSGGLYAREVCPQCGECSSPVNGPGGPEPMPYDPESVAEPNGEIYCQTGMRLTDEELCHDSPCCHWNTDEPGDASFNGAGRCWSSIGQQICSTPAATAVNDGCDPYGSNPYGSDDGCDPYSSNGNACDPYGSDDGCDPYSSDPYGSDDGCDPYGSNGDACDPYAVVAVTTTLAPMNQTGGQPSGGPSALPTCSGDANSWNAGYGPCTSYAGMNHGYCSMDMSEGLYARDVCPQCGQCSSPVLAQIRHGLRRNKMRDQVWKQRNERDSKVVASEAKVKAASTKKQKTAEPIAKQKVTAASGEAVMFQAAQTMSRSSNELRL